MCEQITLSQLYLGESVFHNERYESPSVYIQPFLKRFSDENCQVKVVVKRGSLQYEYMKVLVSVIIPSKNQFQKTLNITYSLDKREPLLKVYQTYYDTLNNIMIANEQCKYFVIPLKHYTIESISADMLNFPKIDNVIVSEVVNKDIQDLSLSTLLKHIQNTSFSNEYETILLPRKLIFSLISFMSDNEKLYFTYDLFTHFYSKIILQKKDISNRYEKIILLNKFLLLLSQNSR